MDSLNELVAYISRNEVTVPKYLSGFSIEPENFEDMVERIATVYGQKHGKLYFHAILAFDPIEDAGKTPEEVYHVARYVGNDIAHYKHQHLIGIMDLHLDTEPAHVHYLFNNIDINTGKRFSPNRRDLADIKQSADYDLRHFGFSGIRMFHPQHRNRQII